MCVYVEAGVKTLVAVTEEVGEFARVLQLQERSAKHIVCLTNIYYAACFLLRGHQIEEK